ncbi:MAG: tyrosine--tRNA ligase, partial [Sandaracinobacter sp.]
RDVGKFLRLFTDVPDDEIRRLEALEGAEINDAQVALANAATALCRGTDAATAAEATARATFAEGGAGEALPSFAVEGSVALVDALVLTGLAASKGEARRKIAENAVKVDGVSVGDPAAMVAAPAKLSLGKKRHAVLTQG